MALPITSEKRYTPEAYFDLSESAEERYEYEHGKLVAMGSSTGLHSELMLNAAMALKQAVRGRGCKAYAETVKLEVEADGKYYLPDVMLTCDERDRQSPKVKRYPGLLIEVLSESSVQRDRDEKFKAYLGLPSLRYYLLIAQNQVRVDVFEKAEGQKGWFFDYFTELTDVIELKQLDLPLRLADIYEEVEWLPEEEND